MKKLEIILSEQQYQHMQAAIQYQNRIHLSEGVFGGYELRLSVGVPDIMESNLELRTHENIDLGAVNWKLKHG